MIFLEFLASIPDGIRLMARHPWKSLGAIMVTMVVASVTIPHSKHDDTSPPPGDRRIVKMMKWLWEREE